jgi:transposase InsO family protein
VAHHFFLAGQYKTAIEAYGGRAGYYLDAAAWAALVNHKRVLRIMREDNLLAVQPRAFVVTTDSDHEFEVYLNLASRMKLTGINQLWVADITYIRLQKEFVYLAVILDAFSRKVVGWALDRTLAARLPIALWSRPLRYDSRRRVWCIILTAVCSTLLESTRRSCESGSLLLVPPPSD